MEPTRALKKIRAATIATVGAVAFGALIATGVGIANADTVQTEGSYPSRAACQDAGPGVQATTPGNWDDFWCVPDREAAGNWRLVLAVRSN
jgi:hypothetical protein